MINHIYVDGVQVDNEQCFLTGISDVAAGDVDINSYARGGRAGAALGMPFYRGFAISLELSVVGTTFADLVTQRERLVSFFRLKSDKTVTQTKTLGFELPNGIVKQVPVVFGPLRGGISADDKTSGSFQISARSEMEYFVSSLEKQITINIFDAGGMTIPMDIVMSMAVSPSQLSSVLRNEGNAEFYPTIVLHAPLTTFSLLNETTGKSISYSGTLSSTDTIVLDLYNRTAIKNGTTNVLASITGTWWWLEPGDNQIKLTTSTGAGYATVTYRDAYRGL